MKSQIVTFLIKCPDQKGLVAKITTFFYEKGFNILSCQQYANAIEDTYFMRIRLNATGTNISKETLEKNFFKIVSTFEFRLVCKLWTQEAEFGYYGFTYKS